MTASSVGFVITRIAVTPSFSFSFSVDFGTAHRARATAARNARARSEGGCSRAARRPTTFTQGGASKNNRSVCLAGTGAVGWAQNRNGPTRATPQDLLSNTSSAAGSRVTTDFFFALLMVDVCLARGSRDTPELGEALRPSVQQVWPGARATLRRERTAGAWTPAPPSAWLHTCRAPACALAICHLGRVVYR